MRKGFLAVLAVVLLLGLVCSAQAFQFGFVPMAPQTPAHWPVGAGGQVTYQTFFGTTAFVFMGQGLVPGEAYELVAKSLTAPTTGQVFCLGEAQASMGGGSGSASPKAGALNLYAPVPLSSIPKGKVQFILLPACQVNCAGHSFAGFNPDEAFFGASIVTIR